MDITCALADLVTESMRGGERVNSIEDNDGSRGRQPLKPDIYYGDTLFIFL